jgi:protein-S-isoprenylcysteine O-methyltransferase Ste14
MYIFLIPLLAGFIFNWASAFTHFYSKRWGERAGKMTSFIFRNILGIPVWVWGLALAVRASAVPLFNPSSFTKTLGWLLLVIATIPMIWGLFFLRLRAYRPTEHDTLVSGGIFKHIRHPIYSGLLIDFAAIILLRPATPVLIACVLGWGFVLIQARLEEIDLVKRIPAYREYMQEVPRFFPRLWK